MANPLCPKTERERDEARHERDQQERFKWRANERADAAERRITFTQEWYATRFEAIKEIAKEAGIWDEVASIMANGTRSPTDPPTYAQQLNAAKYRAEAAESYLARLEEALEAAHKGLRIAEKYAEHMANDLEPHANQGSGLIALYARATELLGYVRSALTRSTPPRSDG